MINAHIRKEKHRAIKEGRELTQEQEERIRKAYMLGLKANSNDQTNAFEPINSPECILL